MIIASLKEDLMPLYDFCNVISQDMLDMKDIDNLPKFKVNIDKGSILCMVRNKNAESIHITFKGHGVVFIDDGKKEKVYKIIGDCDREKIISILTNEFSVELNSVILMKSNVNQKKKEG